MNRKPIRIFNPNLSNLEKEVIRAKILTEVYQHPICPTMQQLIKIKSKTNKGLSELKKEPNFYKVFLIV